MPEEVTPGLSEIYDCLIVGAGISGLTAADYLQQSGWKVAVLDKARGAGGRMATRRKKTTGNPLEEANPVWDHGAQFMTLRSPVVQRLVGHWQANMQKGEYGQLRDWLNLASFEDLYTGNHSTGNQATGKWIGSRGMTTLPKYLAASLTTFFETRIVKIALHACLPVSLPAWFWELTAEDGRQFRGQNIVLAMPVPQAVMLIEASQELFEKLSTASFNTDAFEKIKAVQFDPCLAVLAELSSSSKVPAPGFIELKRVESTASDVLAFLGDNHQKGISAVHTVTLHATPEWSKTYFDAPETEITHSLIQAAAPWIDSSHVVSTQLMRWRYSQVRGCAVNSSISPTLFPEGFCMLCTQPALLLAGDGFGGSRIETAILSGLSVGKALTKNACLGLI